MAALLGAHGPALRRVAPPLEPVRRRTPRTPSSARWRSTSGGSDSVERATEAAWLKVVIRNEALAIRRARGESVGREDVDLDTRVAADLRALEDRLASRERAARSAEALRELKPDEALALLMKAEGHSYQEIAESQGWTYTKVNRSITEGRARFLKTFRAIEEGESCERLAPLLAALAAGSATAAQLREARPHLRHCAHCRATLRALHVPLRQRVAALLPFGVVVEPLRQLTRRGARPNRRRISIPSRRPRSRGRRSKLPAALEHAERASRLPSPRPAFQALLHRIANSDFVTSAQVAASTGGGRTAAVAALIGVCLSGVGAGTYCVATALLPDPPMVKAEQPATKNGSRPHRPHDDPPPHDRPGRPSPAPWPWRPSAPTPTPTRRTQSRPGAPRLARVLVVPEQRTRARVRLRVPRRGRSGVGRPRRRPRRRHQTFERLRRVAWRRLGRRRIGDEWRGVPAVRGTRALLRILGCCAAMALYAPPAHAGVYDVWSCQGA